MIWRTNKDGKSSKTEPSYATSTEIKAETVPTVSAIEWNIIRAESTVLEEATS